MTRAMAREGCARATRLSTRSRSVDDAARGPSVRRLGGRFAKTTVTGGRRRAVARAADGGVVPSNFKKFTEIFANLFPIWTILAAVAGVMRPNTFSFMTSGAYTGCLALLMFSMGITLTIDDFKRVFAKPRVIGLGFFACYALMPALAFVIGNALGLSGPLLAGLILVGSINGGQASNLCAYIAKGDVALSVLMTTATTVGCIFMTPLICKLALGAVVDVDAMGMAISTIQVVLVPVVLGLTLNKFTPKFCRRVEPISPVVGVTATIILVGRRRRQLRRGHRRRWFHASSCRLFAPSHRRSRRLLDHARVQVRRDDVQNGGDRNGDEVERLWFLARVSPLSRVPQMLAPSAVSVVWMAVLGSTMAVIWRFIPVPEEE